MKQPPRIFTTRLRVRYAETDQMGVVYHANYLVWFEIGRVEMLRDLGFAYRQLEIDEDCALPVVEVTCRYRSPARYDEELELETRLLAWRGSVLKFAYQLRRPEPSEAGENRGGTLLAEAVTTHIVVDRSLNKRLLPEAYARAMQALLSP
jgi:acyl-CoA thioester hydrolase